MTFATLARAVFIILCSQAPASAHSEHSRADSVEGAAMSAVVVDYHRLIAEGDPAANRLLAPAYVQAEMDGHGDPRRWRPSGRLPGSEAARESSGPIFGYSNDVEVLHVRARGDGGLVFTREVGSYLKGSWDTHNAWIMVRVDTTWRIGASLHDLPQDLLCLDGPDCATAGGSLPAQ